MVLDKAHSKFVTHLNPPNHGWPLEPFQPFHNSNCPVNNELATVLDQMICGRRQLRFEIYRDFRGKIGMNTTANKLFFISNKIPLDLLNLSFVHYKKIAKIQFLKYGKT